MCRLHILTDNLHISIFINYTFLSELFPFKVGIRFRFMQSSMKIAYISQ